MKDTLKLWMNGDLAGELCKATTGALTFRYDVDWLAKSDARPISLSLPLRKQAYSGDRVYNFFDNLLPDNLQLRSHLQARLHIATSHPFDLLKAIGKECIGAITLVPENFTFQQDMVAKPVSDQHIAQTLQNIHQLPLGIDPEEDFRFSLAGAQDKTAFLRWKNRWYRPLGATPSTHIFKLPIGRIENQGIDLRESCENEWLCTQIAKAFGLPVAETRIAHFNGIKALVVKRFDRKWSDDKQSLIRLPQEDFCQALGCSPNLKYEADGGPGFVACLKLLGNSSQMSRDRVIFFRSQVLFFLLAAIDGHAKNFSLFIEPGGTYHLAPLYDILSAFPLISKRQLAEKKIKLAMAVQGKNKHYHWHTIYRRHFLETAEKAFFPVAEAEKSIDTLCAEIDSVIARVTKHLPADFPAHISESIFEGMRRAGERLR